MIFEGVRVLDLSRFVAGGFCTSLLADLGAEVIKVEEPGQGDSMRAIGPFKDGVSLWWKVLSRNKKSVTIDLRRPAGAELCKALVAKSDVVVENFRPGTLERWGLGPDVLAAVRPNLVLLRVSGFGQDGAYRDRPAFGRVGEAVSGVTYITGFPGGPPLHMGFPLADYTTRVMGAFAVASALFRRERSPAPIQVIDLALYETVYRMLEFLVVQYDQLGVVAEREGNRLPHAYPVDVFRTRDGRWVTLSCPSDATAHRLFDAIGRPDLKSDPRFSRNEQRVVHTEELQAILQEWFGSHDRDEVLAQLLRADVPHSPIYSAADLVESEQFRSRGNIVEVVDGLLGVLRMQGVVPRFVGAEGRVRTPGPALGEHNEEVLLRGLGLSREDYARLEAAGVVGPLRPAGMERRGAAGSSAG
ncbi:MAG: CoA transferase [Clostridia bacterium]|nr:CoA transferase [Clostridia bacterium]